MSFFKALHAFDLSCNPVLEGRMWKIHLYSIKPFAEHEENSITPHRDVKVAGPGNCLEGAATVS